MDQLLQLPLSRVEEQELEAFLLGSPEPHSAELLVMYYLQKARYVEAIRLNEKIKHSMLVGSYDAMSIGLCYRNIKQLELIVMLGHVHLSLKEILKKQ